MAPAASRPRSPSWRRPATRRSCACASTRSSGWPECSPASAARSRSAARTSCARASRRSRSDSQPARSSAASIPRAEPGRVSLARMSRRPEAPGAVALGVAVFLSGAALLGIEIVASRVLAPSFGSSLYVWGSLIGVVLSGLAIGYWAGGVLSDRFPTPYLLTGTLTLGALLVLLVPVLDAWVIEQIVAWDPGPRLDPLFAAIALFAPVSIVLAAATPIAVRLAARSHGTARAHRGPPLLRCPPPAASSARSSRPSGSCPSSAPTRCSRSPPSRCSWPRRATRSPSACCPSALALVVAAAAAGAVVTTLSPQESGRIQSSALRNWSPLYREHEQRSPGNLSPDQIAAEEIGLRRARGARHALPPHVRARRQRRALPPLRQHVPERDGDRRPVRDRLRVHRLPRSSAWPTRRRRAACSSSASAAGRR